MDKKLLDLLELERDEKLFERQYKGIYYWQSVRLFVFRRILTSYNFKIEKRVKKDGKLKKFLSLLTKSIVDISNWKRLKERDLLYFDSQVYRRVDGKKRDIYFDFWEFEKNYTVNRCYYDMNVEQQSNASSAVGMAVPDFVHDICFFVLEIFGKVYCDKEEEFLSKVYGIFVQKWGNVFSEEDFKRRIKDAVITHKIYGKFFEILLSKAKPKAIFVVGYYIFKLFPLYDVAKRCSIPVIDLCHGSANNHDQYNYLDTSNTGKELPDYFWIYGDLTTKYIRLPECMNIKVVGNPFLDNRKLKYSKVEMNEKAIVFYMDLESCEEMVTFVKQFLEKHCNEGYKIYCKMHPAEAKYMRTEKRTLEGIPDIKVVSVDAEVYELLSMAKHHVSGPSTVLYESALFNVRRYLLKKNDYYNGLMEPLLKSGLVETFKSYTELEQLLFKTNEKKHMKEDEIYKENAKAIGNNILRELIN